MRPDDLTLAEIVGRAGRVTPVWTARRDPGPYLGRELHERVLDFEQTMPPGYRSLWRRPPITVSIGRS